MKKSDGSNSSDPRRWKALGVLCLVQFMLILDMTVVNVALPHVQRDLGFTNSGLAWVVNGYVLMAGGFLLLGGRLADILGRRRLFMAGTALFAVASATCGAAQEPWMLVASRFAQGLGEAAAAPASLGLIAMMFTDPHERIRAIGIWGGIAGLGGTSGTVISGFLTDFASWRWIFFINLPVALFALLVVPRLISESKMGRDSHHTDYFGAVTGTGGLVAMVYGLLQAAEHPWGSSNVLLPLLSGVGLLAAMLVIESRSPSPLIPLEFFRNRTRVTANLGTLVFSSAFFSYVFLLTLFEQKQLGWRPIESGLSYLPFGFAIMAGIGLGMVLMPKIGVKPLLAAGFFLNAFALFLSSNIEIDSQYVSGILPGMMILGIGAGMSFPALTNAALHQVTGQDSSLASGMQAAVQQIGGALGLATLVTLALRHAASQMSTGVDPHVAFTDGYALAFRVGVGLMVVGAILVVLLLEHVAAAPRNPMAEAEPDAEPSQSRSGGAAAAAVEPT